METAIGGAIIGVAVAVVAPSIVSGILGALRPLVKEVIKGGIVAYEAVSGLVSETGESFKDLVAEAKNDIEKSKTQAGSGNGSHPS
jgi:hypothetical protein